MILKNEDIKYIFIKPVKRFEVTIIEKSKNVSTFEDEQKITVEYINWKNIPRAAEYCIENKMDLDQLHDTLSMVFHDDGTVDLSFQK